MTKDRISAIFFAVLAGAVNGVLGTGGGIVLVLYLRKRLENEQDVTKSALTVTLLCTLLMSAASAILYIVRGSVEICYALPYLLPSVIGGLLGALVFSKIKPSVLNALFSLLVLWSGLRMLVR